jgi:hypothetical protein
MNKQVLLPVFLGLALVTLVVTGVLVVTRKNRVELTGAVLKVRSYQIDPERTLGLVDLRVQNPSTQQFVVNEVEIVVEEPDGQDTPAEIFSETDAQRTINYYTAIGKKYTPGLLRREKINSGQSVDRSMLFSAPMSDERLQKRRALRIVVHDVDGATTQIVEKR